jgi:serine/threonine-protein kinase
MRLEAGAELAKGRFRLNRPIGHGGMASVWSAHHSTLGRDVALKLAPLDDDERSTARFLREAQIIGKLDHPNIVSVLDAGQLEDERHSFLMMELLQGAPLSARLVPGVPLPPSEIVPIVLDICRGLEAAHAAGVVHLDIKPENVFLTESGATKLVDFGISRAIDHRHAAPLGADEAIVGTPAYMSPEQALGLDVDARADVWAVGVLLHEALAGQQPFGGASPSATLRQVLDAAPPKLAPSVDPRLRRIVTRCLEKDPARRYGSAAALRAELEPLMPAHVARRPAQAPSLVARDAATLATPAEPARWLGGRQARRRALSLLALATLAVGSLGAALTAADAAPRLVLRTGLAHAVSAEAAVAVSPAPAPVEPAASPPAASTPPAPPSAPPAPRRTPAPLTRVMSPGF